jgi:hypothetical protein
MEFDLNQEHGMILKHAIVSVFQQMMMELNYLNENQSRFSIVSQNPKKLD